MIRATRRHVMALTLAATSLTVGAAALADATPSATTSTPADVGTPLPIRPSKPTVITAEPTGLGIGYKIAFGVILAAGGFIAWKKRAERPLEERRPILKIKARTGIGVRSELIIVDVEGQTLLLGVTPNSIQRLAVLPDGLTVREPAEQEDVSEEIEEAGFSQSLRSAADRLFTRAPASTPPPARTSGLPRAATVLAAKPAPAPRREREVGLEEQARGLMRAGRA